MVLVTVGRKSTADSLGLEKAGVATDKRGWITVDQHLMTNVPGIYAIGDILGPSHVMLAHVASMEGLCALDNILGKERAMDYSVIPSAIFTSPEIGEVGMSEAQAKESCQKVVTGTVQMRELGKAHAMGELPGFFKVIADAESGTPSRPARGRRPCVRSRRRRRHSHGKEGHHLRSGRHYPRSPDARGRHLRSRPAGRQGSRKTQLSKEYPMKQPGELTLPADLRYTSEHIWIKKEGDQYVAGVTDYAQDQLGRSGLR